MFKVVTNTYLDCNKDFSKYIDNLNFSEDGTLNLGNEYIDLFVMTWEKLGFLRDVIDLEERQITSYNLTMIWLYALKCKPKEYVCEQNVFNLLIPTVRRIGKTGVIENPTKLWNYFTYWVNKHIDYIEGLANRMHLDIEAEIVSLFERELMKILKENN